LTEVIGYGHKRKPMADPLQPMDFQVSRSELVLAGDAVGDGEPIVLLHGLSATRRNVVQGSRHLARRGYGLIAYDARGHGDSSPAPDPSAYDYGDLADDLRAVLEHFRLECPVLAGSSMGAATAVAWALRHPGRAAALVLITPPPDERPEDDWWDQAAEALERNGVEGFLDMVVDDDLPSRWRDPARKAAAQRMERHRHLEAVADALRTVPRAQPFEGLEELERLDLPTLVVGSRDEADPVHPLEVAEAYAEHLPRSRLVVEDEDDSPLAWRGAQLSREIGDFLEEAGIRPDGD
jgi:pimeloyl-ACP methyl ester carboxylesterase